MLGFFMPENNVIDVYKPSAPNLKFRQSKARC